MQPNQHWTRSIWRAFLASVIFKFFFYFAVHDGENPWILNGRTISPSYSLHHEVKNSQLSSESRSRVGQKMTSLEKSIGDAWIFHEHLKRLTLLDITRDCRIFLCQMVWWSSLWSWHVVLKPWSWYFFETVTAQEYLDQNWFHNLIR